MEAQTSTCFNSQFLHIIDQYLMIFQGLMIEKTFPYPVEIQNYSSISNKLFDLRLPYL